MAIRFVRFAFAAVFALFAALGCAAADDSTAASVATAPGPTAIWPIPDRSAPPVPIAVGKGSYASYPPASAGKTAEDKDLSTLHVDDLGDRPVPTNHWWTDMLINGLGGQLWAFPMMVKPRDRGLDIYYPTRWNDAGTDPVAEYPLTVGGENFTATDARARSWGDWTYTFRYMQDSDHSMDVTLGRGMPCVWIECHAVTPTLDTGGPAEAFDLSGADQSLPVTGDSLGLEFGGRHFAVFAPDGTRFEMSGGVIRCAFSGGDHYLVVCALPRRSDIALFHRVAFAVPRESRLTWFYDPVKARVVTAWRITAAPLKQGVSSDVIQGWLPHQWRIAGKDLDYNGLEYMTPRGTLKCTVGSIFRLYFPFDGVLPVLPAPHKLGLPNDYDESRMRGYLAAYATRTKYGDDTYWGAKDLTQMGLYMTMARQMNDSSFDALRGNLRTALTDWYTYTPGENAHYFAAYAHWHGLIGFHDSYGSEQFNDNHFHYGYFTFATALLGMYDQQWLRDYGPMATLVAKQYANWDRSDLRFPFLRTFDVWEGHSWAGGFSGGTGENQESSSEAMQSWGGLYLLGTMLGNSDMQSAGAMGYAMESQAVDEYWFNRYGTNFSPNYHHPICGMVWGGGDDYGTYFTGDPAWIFGINWLPISPMMDYLARDPAYVKRSVATMFAERESHEHKTGLPSLGTGLGNVVLSYAQYGDPDWVAAQYDQLWAAGDPIAHDTDTGGIGYYMTHAGRMLGTIRWDYHATIPTSRVYADWRTGALRYIVYNPSDQAQTATFYHGDTPVGTLQVPAHELVTATHLAP